jgi:hypothetical protein
MSGERRNLAKSIRGPLLDGVLGLAVAVGNVGATSSRRGGIELEIGSTALLG